MTHRGLDFFGLILFGVYSDSWICIFVYFTNFGKLLAIILSLFFSPIFLLVSFVDSDDTNAGYSVIVSQVPVVLFTFFFFWSIFCCLEWLNFVVLTSRSLTLSCHLYFTTEPIYWGFKIFCSCIFQFSKFHLDFFFFFIILTYILRLSICSFVSRGSVMVVEAFLWQLL